MWRIDKNAVGATHAGTTTQYALPTSLNPLQSLVHSTQTDDGPAPPPPTIQGHLPPICSLHHGFHPAPILVDLLLLATQQTQKELDSPTHDLRTDVPEIHAVTHHGWSPYQSRPFVGGPAEEVEMVQLEICVGTGIGEGGYCGNGGGACGESRSQTDCYSRLLDFEGWRRVVTGIREGSGGREGGFVLPWWRIYCPVLPFFASCLHADNLCYRRGLRTHLI